MTFMEIARSAHGVKRYHTECTIGTQSVAEHSFGVGMLVLYLTNNEASGNLLRAALFHDLAEQYTGDVPSMVKWDNKDLKAMLDKIEDNFVKSLGVLQDLTAEEVVILKWADMLELLYFCLEQRRLGNLNATNIFIRAVNFLNQYTHLATGSTVLDEIKRQFPKDHTYSESISHV